MELIQEIRDLRQCVGGQLCSKGNNNIIAELQQKVLIGDGGEDFPKFRHGFLPVHGIFIRQHRHQTIYPVYDLSVVKIGNRIRAVYKI